jgi:transposase
MKRSRKNYTAEEKVAILRRHLLDRVPVSDLCEELNLQPTVFYRWQKEFFENGTVAFQSPRMTNKPYIAEKRIAALEEKLRRKNEVLGELMEEHVQLKKNLGEL